jgi:antitoxin ParD1/3/4
MIKGGTMPRQSISFTPPNEEWLRAQVESQEYTSKSDVVNDLIRKAREIEAIRSKLVLAEQSGFTGLGRAEILEEAKAEARRNGIL